MRLKAYFAKKQHSFSPAFTLIELLVVIAVIAILSVVVVLTLNPAELLRQGRDATRLSDLDTLNHALSLYSSDQSGAITFSMGSPSTTYVSIPDPLATSTAGDQCQGLGLPALDASSGYVYHCAASSTFRAINGTGWIPITFSSISSGAPIGSLPIDGANVTSSNLFYTYTTDGTKYEVTAIFESQKYRAQYAANPILTAYPEVAAQGTSLSLSELYNPNGLVGYWPLNEGSGSVARDLSGNGNNGTWSGTPAGTNSTYYGSAKVGTSAGYFLGSNSDYISIPTITLAGDFTISAWIYPYQTPNQFDMLFGSVSNPNNNLNFYNQLYRLYTGSADAVIDGQPTPPNAWVQVIITRSGTGLTLYHNGIARSGGSNNFTFIFTTIAEALAPTAHRMESMIFGYIIAHFLLQKLWHSIIPRNNPL